MLDLPDLGLGVAEVGQEAADPAHAAVELGDQRAVGDEARDVAGDELERHVLGAHAPVAHDDGLPEVG
ncbi:hypothetical protein ACWDOR_09225 [Streptosporangium canum]|uniref:hypothetical protein n=1 Tax=Streptosporangium canum TaxID=324952 RepID=UPI0036C9EC29